MFKRRLDGHPLKPLRSAAFGEIRMTLIMKAVREFKGIYSGLFV